LSREPKNPEGRGDKSYKRAELKAKVSNLGTTRGNVKGKDYDMSQEGHIPIIKNATDQNKRSLTNEQRHGV